MSVKKINSRRLLQEDIDRSCEDLANYLLGKVLVRQLDNQTILKGRIVETEAYLGDDDKGSHSYNGRRSAANEPMYLPAGTCYVYMTYGMYHCLNVSSKEPGAAVLLRALEPLFGMEIMEQRRTKNTKSGKVLNFSQLCNGPSKLCIAMDITKSNCNKLDITDPQNESLWLEDDPEFIEDDIKIISCPRIGINSAGEWISKPLRYYIFNNEHVSKKNKMVEKGVDVNTNN